MAVWPQLWLLLPLCMALTAAASTPPQIPFSTTPSPSSLAHLASHSRVVRFTWGDKASTRAALDLLEGMDSVDIWRKHPHALELRLSDADDEARITALLSSAAPPTLSTVIDSLPLLQTTSPSLFAPYNARHSRIALENLSSLAHSALDDPIHKSYHPYDAMAQILRQMERDFKGFAKVVSFGKSSEGREILGITVTNAGHVHPHPHALEEEEEEGLRRKKKSKKGKKHPLPHKLGFVTVGGQHAREWVAPATILYLAHRLLLSSKPSAPAPAPPPFSAARHTDPDTARLMNIFTFTFIPVLNVDGYIYSWETDRLWRKSRTSVGKGCYGIDLGRNWGFKWSAGQRPNPCSAAYPGKAPFEAPELQALKKFLTEPQNHVSTFLDLHSFGSQFQFPYSYSCEKSSPDEEDHFEAAVGAMKSLKQIHGRSFEVGSSCSIALTAPGSSIDWTYSVARIKWSYLLELRDYLWGFLLPPIQIVPSGEELFAALETLAAFVEKKETGRH